MRELIQSAPCSKKEEILRHLKNGKEIAIAAGRARDIFTGKEIPGSLFAYSDGVFEWRSDEIYYFEKYNIKLEDEFIAHVLKKA